ncbi:hypothetical protein S1OALGB6SA_1183 [Olavius algarvensis spirochete endosymbiont]|nr:MAG: hypothetical protein [Olavius algarvensis spirochete endosymbiont]VDB00109.1 hypothetical protein S1OALGB6SA_1183 [Olavius algarvensis spirochete endosymbiont]
MRTNRLLASLLLSDNYTIDAKRMLAKIRFVHFVIRVT